MKYLRFYIIAGITILGLIYILFIYKPKYLYKYKDQFTIKYEIENTDEYSWSYEIEASGTSAAIYWTNSNLNENVNIAIILQYGHGTGSGGYVVGRDYINPAIRPVFDHIADAAWKEVVNS